MFERKISLKLDISHFPKELEKRISEIPHFKFSNKIFSIATLKITNLLINFGQIFPHLATKEFLFTNDL